MRRTTQLVVLAVVTLVVAGGIGGCVDQSTQLTIDAAAPTDDDRANFPNIPDYAIVIKYNAVSNENYTLTIHTTNGVLVKTLAHNQRQEIQDIVVHPWDLTDNTDQRVVPGVYVVNYQTPTIHTIFTLFVH